MPLVLRKVRRCHALAENGRGLMPTLIMAFRLVNFHLLCRAVRPALRGFYSVTQVAPLEDAMPMGIEQQIAETSTILTVVE